MKKDELIKKMKETTSVVEFYKLKPEILAHLGAAEDKAKRAGSSDAQ